MGWDDDDKLERAAGLRGVPRWVWIAGAIVALIIIGAIMRGGGSGGSSSSATTTPTTEKEIEITRKLNSYDIATGQIIDPINGFDSSTGIKKVCSYSHGQTVKILDTSRERVKVEGRGCVGWLSKAFLE